MSAAARQEFVSFLPTLRAGDDLAAYWLRQVNLRLRREVCWLWQERGVTAPDSPAALPPFTDPAQGALDASRFWREKRAFFQQDPTAEYLSRQLAKPRPESPQAPARGSFAWIVEQLALDPAASFVLALALGSALDGSMGSVIALCQNDAAKVRPSLALAQKLWDHPTAILPLADPAHPLFRTGLLAPAGVPLPHGETDWEQPLATPALVARQILVPEAGWPEGLALLAAGELPEGPARLAALRLCTAPAAGLRVLPVLGPPGAARPRLAAAIAGAAGQKLAGLRGEAAQPYLNTAATLCWLRGAGLYLDGEALRGCGDKGHAGPERLPASGIPVNLYLALEDRRSLAGLPAASLLAAVEATPLGYEARLRIWRDCLGPRAEGREEEIAEIARRFRYEETRIEAVAAELCALPGPLDPGTLTAACRAELTVDLGDLAAAATPRFRPEQLILPPKQARQFEEHVRAMRALTEVHYGWGTARAWNEAGISVLFSGPPGTGKTMAAEALAMALDLPMYRIDLSQVVNKYIGETEKNLKRVFDAADVSDLILFFDEADALFGRRTEVSDAHDRYANLEISYLLERMERFKGLAILATNRKKDLDEAFLRRLRYIIDFPLPETEQRRQIWRQMVPANADASDLDFDFLARQFAIAGGNIRSIVFNACLQCAGDGSRRLRMREVLIAVKREYDKMNRSLSPEQFGAFAPLIRELEAAP